MSDSPSAHHLPYLRLIFTVYWQNASPESAIFYVEDTHPHRSLFPLPLTRSAIATLEQTVATLLQQGAMNEVVQVIYAGYSSIMMTPEEVTDAGWYVITE